MNWTLRRKILAGYAAALLVAGVVLGLALLNIVRLGSATDAILRENYHSIVAAEQMRDALQRQENAALLLTLSPELPVVKRFSESERIFLTWLGRAQENITIEGEAEVLHRIESGYQRFLLALARLRQTLGGDLTARLALYRQEIEPQADTVRRGCKELHELNRDTMQAASSRARQIADTALWSMSLTTLAVLAAALVGSAALSRRIVLPIQRLTGVTEQVAAGDYDVDLQPESRDEVGRLTEKFGAMVSQLRAYRELNLRHLVGEQIKAETILQTIDDGVLVVDTAGRVTSLNPTAARALGLPAVDVRGAELAQVVGDANLRQGIERVLVPGEDSSPPREPTYLSLATPGGTLYYEYSIAPIATAEGTSLGAVVLLRNVTKLRELDRLKTEFVMTASHELRTPLTSIIMSIGLLQERAACGLSEPDRQLLDIVQEELDRMQALVNELLDLTRIESGQVEMAFAEVSVRQVIEAAVLPFRIQAEERKLALTVDVPDPAPVVQADPNKLAWIVSNLVGNALRYARTSIQVSAKQAGRWIHLYVRDDGQGIPYEHQARIFDKFVQVEGQTHAGGAGLGLAIAKEIVRAHRGSIWVESEPGLGSLFIVALPAHRSTR